MKESIDKIVKKLSTPKLSSIIEKIGTPKLTVPEIKKIGLNEGQWDLGTNSMMSQKGVNETEEQEPLDFGTAPDAVVGEFSSSSQEPEKIDNSLPIANQRRLLLKQIQDDQDTEYPQSLVRLASVVKNIAPDGSSATIVPDHKSGLDKKALAFIMNGRIDALASESQPEYKKLVLDVAQEINRQILDSNVNRKLKSLAKKGEIDEIINYHLKTHHYHLFSQEWLIKFMAAVHRKLFEIRKTNKI